MHDIKWIREHPNEFDLALRRRNLNSEDSQVFSSQNLISIDERRRAIIRVNESWKERRNAVSRKVGAAKRSGEEMSAQAMLAEMAEIKDSISNLEGEEKAATKELDDVLAWIPNLPLPAPEVPDGNDEKDNVEHHHFGVKREYGFAPKQHFELGETLGQMDFETAAKLSGARFVVLKSGLARMERALGQFMLDLHTNEHGYTEVAPPLLVNDESMFGTTQLPKFREDQFPTKIVRQKINPEPIVVPLEQFLINALRLGTFEPSDRPQVTINLEMGGQPRERRWRKKEKSFEDYLATNLNLLTLSGQDRPSITIKFEKDGQLHQRAIELKNTMSLLRNAIAHSNVSPEISFRSALQTILEKENFESLWLIPTSEVPLTNFVRGSILDEAQLPMRLTALTPCFRAEAGAAGKDMRGMIRQHQFNKVELVSITTPEQSKDEHERMLSCAEEVLRRLDLHYRVVTLCAGDMGFAAQKTYDIEVWLPGQNMYREISSCSVCGDFQARRMNARYRTKDRAVRHVHTLNGSGVAVGRALIAVMETYQQQGGSIAVPDALQPYMGGLKTIEHVK